MLAAAASPTSDMTPRTRAALTGEPELLHAFRDMATLRTIELDGRPTRRSTARAPRTPPASAG